MSASETREAIRLLERIAAERELTLLFTEHDMEVVFSIAQKIAVLHQGQLIAEGTPAEVAREPGSAARLSRESDIDALLEVHDIHAAYGSSRVLFGVSLTWRAANASACSDATASARPRPCEPSWG